jgi:hypothetical protein
MKKVYMLATAVVMVGLSANAALIAEYTFAGSSYASSDADASSTASDISNGGGLTLSFETRTAGVRGNPVPSIKYLSGDVYNDGSVLDNDYIAFTVTANSGSITFDSMSFWYSGGADKDVVYVFSSQSGFASVGSAIDVIAIDGSLDYTVSLSGLTEAAESSTTEFRLYFDTSASFSAERFIDNMSVTSAIPEPATLGMVASAGALLMLLRRRMTH